MRIKSYSQFINENESNLTFENIVNKYCDSSEFSDYKSKFIITKFLEYYLKLNKDADKLGLQTLEKYSSQIFTQENLNKIRDYKNSDWIKALDIKLDNFIANYPNVINKFMHQMKVYKAKDRIAMMTTNIQIFKLILADINKLLPKEVQFSFVYNGLTDVTDKNFLKILTYYKDAVFSKEKFESYKTRLFGMSNYSEVTENKFIEYLKNKGLDSRKATYEEDIKGLDVIDQNGITYQVKAPSKLVVYKNGYFVPSENQLDIKKIKDADKLVFFSDNKFHIMDTDNITLKKKPNGLYIGLLF